MEGQKHSMTSELAMGSAYQFKTGGGNLAEPAEPARHPMMLRESLLPAPSSQISLSSSQAINQDRRVASPGRQQPRHILFLCKQVARTHTFFVQTGCQYV